MIKMQNNLLIKFLNSISSKLDASLIKNGIILIMALSSEKIHDRFQMEDKFISELECDEKNEVIRILKSEFNNGTKHY